MRFERTSWSSGWRSGFEEQFPKGLGSGLITWVVAFAIFAGFGLADGHWRIDYELEMSGEHTTGIVISSQPDNHGYCGYRYRVGSRTFIGWNQNCPTTRIGSSLEVTYLSQRPFDSVTGTGDGVFADHLIISLLVPTMLAIAVGARAAKRSS